MRRENITFDVSANSSFSLSAKSDGSSFKVSSSFASAERTKHA